MSRLWLLLAGAAMWVSCVPVVPIGPGATSSGNGGAGGQGTTSSTSGSGGAGGQGTTSSSSSTSSSGSPAAENASETVSAGVVTQNGQYRMVFTLGQPAHAQRTLKNANHRLEGGLVGATETTP